MLTNEMISLRTRAMAIISNYISTKGKHGYAVISYDGNPECYVAVKYGETPYMQYTDEKGETIRIEGDTLDGIVTIADAIQEHQSLMDVTVYPIIRVKVKASSRESAKAKAVKYLAGKGISQSQILDIT